MSGRERAVSVRGLPGWLIRDYLADMGATENLAGDDGTDDDPSTSTMRAPLWTVTWTSQRVAIAGSSTLTLTQWDMVFSGEPEAVAEASERFLAKAQRGGG